ncbi:hypothetical protein ES705_25046 [subsurface metagenome]
MKRENIKEESLYTKFNKQHKDQRKIFHDLLIILRMSIEQAKKPVFDKTIFIARIVRDLQDRHLKFIEKNDLEAIEKEKYKNAYINLKIFETDMTIDIIAKVFRELELLARLLMSLDETDIEDIIELIESGKGFRVMTDFYKNKPIDKILKKLYGVDRLKELNLSKKETSTVHELYDTQKELLEDMFDIIIPFYDFSYNIRNNYFHNALWFPHTALDQYQVEEKDNVMHKIGYGMLFSLPKEKRLKNEFIQFDLFCSGIDFIEQLCYLGHGIIAFEKRIVDFYLTNLLRDQILIESAIGQVPEKLLNSFKKLVGKHYETVDLGTKIDQEQTDMTLVNKQENLFKQIKTFNRKYSPVYNRKKNIEKKETVRVNQKLHLIEKEENNGKNDG